ncbi:ThuA domain-containing protein [Niastella populi]|uniref:Crp/Fnr family transcriptional regulator n=1 Tax=Niastella populi TaxID=550983 RepID=A0A1V9FDX0_9BACT|nr:ThuA domain-containing protein [Niastella populi]OQP56558.1 Crp/Fnr family transcriptional regulator [Niastella populi]
MKKAIACQMKIVFTTFCSILTTFCLMSCTTDPLAKDRVLVFSKTAGYHHKSIDAGIKALKEMGVKYKFEVDTTTDSTKFVYSNLKQYAAVIFLNTTGDVLNDEQQKAFQQYIQAGGGFVGIHSATDTEYDWPWYGNLVGAYFVKHPQIQEAVLVINDSTNIATKHLPRPWKRTDEWYNFKYVATDLKVLITIDESSYTGGSNGANHHMAWYHNYDGGRAFYTGLGHTDESYADPLFLQHLWGGIQYAMGKVK